MSDESNDVAGKEQMAVVIRYVNSEGFLGLLVLKKQVLSHLRRHLRSCCLLMA